MKNDPENLVSRRKWLASALMGGGLLLSYGTLVVQGLLYLLPEQVRPRTRKIFAGQLSDFKVGGVKPVYDLEGNQILLKRSDESLKAFSTVCPHLGCRVHWDEPNNQFFCPCHRGVFNADGVAVSGPPADAKQSLFEVELDVDKAGGVVYLAVKDVKKRS